MKRSLIPTLLCTVILIGLAVFVWPTRYRYDHMSDRPVRIDRLSEKSELLTLDGWRALGKAVEAQKTPTEQGVIEWDRQGRPIKAVEGQPWNASALVITGPPSFDVSNDGKSLEWDYRVKNNTKVDYNLDDETVKKLRVMTKFRDGSLAPLNNWVTFLYTPIFMPAGQIVGLTAVRLKQGEPTVSNGPVMS